MFIQPTISNNEPKLPFQAKFLNSEALKQIAGYAVEHGKFDKLNQARKNIDTACLQTRLRVDIGDDGGKPCVTFTRYKPKNSVIVAKSMDDLKIDKVSLFKSDKKQNILKFAFEKIIKLGNNAPKNNMYKNVVIKK